MKNLNLSAIAIYTLKVFVGIFILSFIITVGYSLISGDSFNEALVYWQNDFFIERKVIRYLLIALFIGIYRVYKQRKGEE